MKREHIQKILNKEPFNDALEHNRKRTRGVIVTNDHWTRYEVQVYYSKDRAPRAHHMLMVALLDHHEWYVNQEHLSQLHHLFPTNNFVYFNWHELHWLVTLGPVEYAIRRTINAA